MITSAQDVNNLMEILNGMYPNGMIPTAEVEKVQRIISAQRRCKPQTDPFQSTRNSFVYIMQNLLERNKCVPADLNPVLYDSPIEHHFAVLLYENNFEWMPRYYVGKYRLDFAFPEIRLDIEVDGVTYHGTPDQQKRDKIRDKYLNSKGWVVYRLSAYDAQYKPSQHILQIRNLVLMREKNIKKEQVREELSF